MTSCIEFAGYRDRDGYGRKSRHGKMRYAHRLAYVDKHGLTLDDIDGQVVRHTCDNPPCVNPDHLLLGTQQDNVNDKMTRGRHNDATVSPTGYCKSGHPLQGINLTATGQCRACNHYRVRRDQWRARDIPDSKRSTAYPKMHKGTLERHLARQLTSDAAADKHDQPSHASTSYTIDTSTAR